MTRVPSNAEISSAIRRLQGAGTPVTRATLARAFGLTGADRAAFRGHLDTLSAGGVIALDGKRVRAKTMAGELAVVDIGEPDADGDLPCRSAEGPGTAAIILRARDRGALVPPVGPGDRVLARLIDDGEGGFYAVPEKQIARGQARLLGIFRRTRSGGRIEPVSRKAGAPWQVGPRDLGTAIDGDLVVVEALPERGYGPRRARVREVLGDVNQSGNWSLIALAQRDIRTVFPAAALREAETATLPNRHSPAARPYVDLRDLPLITIDPADARDHDDAVHARQTDAGFVVTVAIADVSAFVLPGSALDREAEARGNSVYLVDRVVPMLPEALSNGLCSLNAGEDRVALVCEFMLGPDGHRRQHRFFRAWIRCVAGLSYEEAQALADAPPAGHAANGLKSTVIDPLWAAYRAMERARTERPPLDLDLPERKLECGPDGQVVRVLRKERLDAHRLIEAMMVMANVCAAETLETARRPVIYRVHAAPGPDRVDALINFLDALGYKMAKGQVFTPVTFNRLLAIARERDEVELVSQMVLRTQAQAIYDTTNIGHFGLHLGRYAHFTSPIRRYADLTVHRALVAALGLGLGAAAPADEARLSSIAEHISGAERQAIAAERDTQDRFLAAYLADRTGASFTGRIAGVTRAGLFVNLEKTGADGFVPLRSLWADAFWFDESRQVLVGQHHGGIYRLGQPVDVRLLEATPVQGGLRFEMQSPPLNASAAPTRGRRPPPAEKGRGRDRGQGPEPAAKEAPRRGQHAVRAADPVPTHTPKRAPAPDPLPHAPVAPGPASAPDRFSRRPRARKGKP